MTTSQITSGPNGNQLPTSTTSTSSTGSSSNPYNLQPTDFIKMMVTQLQNQDPMQPTSNSDLLAQMSQIGQLQSASDLQTTLKSITLQTQIGSASALIGKSVQGLDINGNPITGVVNSVSVAGGNVALQLDTGSSLGLDSVTSIGPAPATTSGAPTTTTGTPTTH
jgi:flagellar basal-body rod modification protein FlgD